MGYCAYKIKQKDIESLKDKFRSQTYYKLVKSMEDFDCNKSSVWFEGQNLWVHNSDEDKIIKYLNKNKISYQ